jgi:flagellar L-ring protein FlgH
MLTWRMLRRMLWFVLIAGVLFPAVGNADSIWQRHNFYSSFFYVDTRARRPGDIVTVMIVENTDIQHQDQRNMSRVGDGGGGLTLKGNISGTNQGATRSVAATANPDFNTTRSFQGSSAYNINQTFTDTVTCTVVAVQPNGCLVIEGYRQRVVTREVRTLRLCGVIRPLDIAFDNTIPSTFVANLSLQYLGRGVETYYTNQTWLGRVLNYLWPF